MHSYYAYSSMGLSHVITEESVPDEFKTGVAVRAVPVPHRQLIAWFTSGFE